MPGGAIGKPIAQLKAVVAIVLVDTALPVHCPAIVKSNDPAVGGRNRHAEQFP